MAISQFPRYGKALQSSTRFADESWSARARFYFSSRKR